MTKIILFVKHRNMKINATRRKHPVEKKLRLKIRFYSNFFGKGYNHWLLFFVWIPVSQEPKQSTYAGSFMSVLGCTVKWLWHVIFILRLSDFICLNMIASSLSLALFAK
jgi:hypothetical protein